MYIYSYNLDKYYLASTMVCDLESYESMTVGKVLMLFSFSLRILLTFN